MKITWFFFTQKKDVIIPFPILMQVIGFEGGSDPPAFQNAERQRMKLSSITHNVSDSNSVITSFFFTQKKML